MQADLSQCGSIVATANGNTLISINIHAALSSDEVIL
jgi:hypothetical protein